MRTLYLFKSLWTLWIKSKNLINKGISCPQTKAKFVETLWTLWTKKEAVHNLSTNSKKVCGHFLASNLLIFNTILASTKSTNFLGGGEFFQKTKNQDKKGFRILRPDYFKMVIKLIG